MANAQGIDISKWQGNIDWQKVKADGYSFAFAKATEGTTYVDPTFQANWQGMEAAGLVRGAYHFFWPTLDPVTQAEHFVQTVSPDATSLPPVLDLEKATILDPAALREKVKAWLDKVESLTGRKAIIYTGSWYWNPHMLVNGQAPGWTGDYDLWVASYTTAAQPAMPTGWSTWTLWQHTDHGIVDGISGHVDLDWYNGPSIEGL